MLDGLDQMGASFRSQSTVNSSGGGPGGPVNPMVTQMATSAAQSAATATASAASTAVAGVSSAVTGLAGIVASTGAASQVGVAVGVAAVTAAAVSSGVVVSVQSADQGNATAIYPPANYTDGFVPPECSADGTIKEGLVELRIEGFPPEALPARKADLEDLFRDLYNEITGK